MCARTAQRLASIHLAVLFALDSGRQWKWYEAYRIVAGKLRTRLPFGVELKRKQTDTYDGGCVSLFGGGGRGERLHLPHTDNCQYRPSQAVKNWNVTINIVCVHWIASSAYKRAKAFLSAGSWG